MPLLALWMLLALRVPTSSAQTGLNLWSIQLSGGLFAPVEASEPSTSLGMRYSKHFTSHVQGGLLTGWTLKRASVDGPGGIPPAPESSVELARINVHLVPVMGFMQVDLTDRSRLVPFLGIGAGYEWLVLDAIDHRTGLTTKATYGNVAWESYAGVGIRLTSRVRVNGELFYNGASLEREVPDASGRNRREAVHANGVGVRAGLDMVFE